MNFAIKIIAPKKVHIFRQYSEATVTRYYAQTIETITNKGINRLIILCDGSDPEEVDLSETLIEAEEKIKELRLEVKYYVFKIIEYPEGAENTIAGIDSRPGEKDGKHRT